MNKSLIRIYFRPYSHNRTFYSPFVWEWNPKNMSFIVDYYKLKIIYK